jgi:hypothetical protein
MARPRPSRLSPAERDAIGAGHRDATGAGPRSFGVWFRPNFALVADPDEPLRYDRRVVVRINVEGDVHYAEGRVLTKHPDKAKSINVLLNNQGLVRGARKEDVVPVIGEYVRKPFEVLKD